LCKDVLIIAPGPVHAAVLDRRGIVLRLESFDQSFTSSARVRGTARTGSEVSKSDSTKIGGSAVSFKAREKP
jgi:hypothetical protein